MAISSKFQLYSHDVTGIVDDIWKTNDITQEQRVNGVLQNISLRDYLNVHFFTFRKELKSVQSRKKYGDYNAWLKDAFKSTDTSFARFKIIGEENTIAADIDFGAYTIDFEIIIQPEKLEALEKYWTNIRKLFLGQTYGMTGKDGKQTQLFVTFGNLIQEDGIDTSQLGKALILRATVAITALVGGVTYNDYEIRLRFGDDITETWYKVAFTNLIRSMVNTGEKVNTQNMPHQIGHLPQMSGLVMSFTMYDMRNGANSILNDISLRAVALGERKTLDPTTPTEITDFTPLGDYEPPTISVRLWNKLTKKEYIFGTYPTQIEQTTANGSFAALNVVLQLAAQNIDFVLEV